MKKTNLYKTILKTIIFSQIATNRAPLVVLKAHSTNLTKDQHINSETASFGGLSNNSNNSRLSQHTMSSCFKATSLSTDDKDKIENLERKYYPTNPTKKSNNNASVYSQHTNSSIRKTANFIPGKLNELNNPSKITYRKCAEESQPYRSPIYMTKDEADDCFQSIHERNTRSATYRQEAIKTDTNYRMKLKETEEKKKERGWNPNFLKPALENQDPLPLKRKKQKNSSKKNKTSKRKNSSKKNKTTKRRKSSKHKTNA